MANQFEFVSYRHVMALRIALRQNRDVLKFLLRKFICYKTHYLSMKLFQGDLLVFLSSKLLFCWRIKV